MILIIARIKIIQNAKLHFSCSVFIHSSKGKMLAAKKLFKHSIHEFSKLPTVRQVTWKKGDMLAFKRGRKYNCNNDHDIFVMPFFVQID